MRRVLSQNVVLVNGFALTSTSKKVVSCCARASVLVRYILLRLPLQRLYNIPAISLGSSSTSVWGSLVVC